MTVQMKQRHGPAADWVSANPVLAVGEFGIETDTGQVKVGDGATAWVDLSYFTPGILTWETKATFLTGDISDPFYVPRPCKILRVYASTPLADGSGDTIFDVKGNGATIFPAAPKPTVAAATALSPNAFPDVPFSLVLGDYVTIEVVNDGGATGRARVYIVFG